MNYARTKTLQGLLCLSFLISPLVSHAAVKGAPTTGGSGVLSATGQTNAPEGTPTREIQDIETKMENFKTGKDVSAEDRAKNAQIKKDILNGTFDLRELSKLALDKYWNQISAAEQNNFVSLMTELLETKAIFSKEQSKAQGKNYTVQYLGDTFTDNKNQAKTRTKIVITKDATKIDIDYKLKKGAGGWKIFDVVVDDASLVENYRFQFDSIISKHGYPELVNRMRGKLNELKAK